MAKCLVIAGDIGLTAPGIVYETILHSLSKSAEVSVISPQIREGLNTLKIKILPSASPGFTHRRAENLFFSLFERNILDDIWLSRQKMKIDKNVMADQDVIISFASFHHYRSVMLGYYLSKKYNKKWIIYSVDAIPAPIGWSQDNRSYRNIRKFISGYISKCDAFLSANEQMLAYQLKPFSNLNIRTAVLYTPIRPLTSCNNRSVSSHPVFLYTGGLYGPRKKDALLDGFRLFLEKVPQAKMVFVGSGSIDAFQAWNDLIEKGNIEIHEYTNDLSEFYQRATVLVDINAWFDNDVFLSSKIVNYLPLQRPIISITGQNSPSRNIFRDDPSILHASHCPYEICSVMKSASKIKKLDLEKRNKYIEMFEVENAIQPLIKLTIGRIEQTI